MSARKRVFVAITLPENIARRIYDLRLRWPDLPCRWIKPENLHITLIPPMYLDDDQTASLAAALKSGLKGYQPFTLVFKRVIYGPPGKSPRMIWIEGGPSNELIALKSAVDDIILGALVPFRQESRPPKPHITACRMFKEEWRLYEPKPEINEQFNVTITVNDIAIMQSILSRGGAEYAVLERIPLGL